MSVGLAASCLNRADVDMKKIHMRGTWLRCRQGGFENNFISIPTTDQSQDVLHDGPSQK
jgi:hypothetical protein